MTITDIKFDFVLGLRPARKGDNVGIWFSPHAQHKKATAFMC